LWVMVEYEADVAELGSDIAELYQRLAPELIRFATALVGPVDAADVLSAAVVKALASGAGSPIIALICTALSTTRLGGGCVALRNVGRLRHAPRQWIAGSCPHCGRRSAMPWWPSARGSGPSLCSHTGPTSIQRTSLSD
jgi:hypothetical protein